MVNEINFENLDRRLLDGYNVIYGAGYNGGRLLKKCYEYNIPVAAFYDDDQTRQGGGMKI